MTFKSMLDLFFYSDNSGRDSAHDRIVRNIMGNYSICSYGDIIPNVHGAHNF